MPVTGGMVAVQRQPQGRQRIAMSPLRQVTATQRAEGISGVGWPPCVAQGARGIREVAHGLFNTVQLQQGGAQVGERNALEVAISHLAAEIQRQLQLIDSVLDPPHGFQHIGEIVPRLSFTPAVADVTPDRQRLLKKLDTGTLSVPAERFTKGVQQPRLALAVPVCRALSSARFGGLQRTQPSYRGE